MLVYAFDASQAGRHDQAKRVVRTLGDLRAGVISTQVLMEFFVVLTRRLSPAVAPAVAERHVADFARSWETVPLDAPTLLEAMRGVREHGFSPRDAQIWAAARLNRVGAVLSEDFSDGRVADGVRFMNPFADSFDPTVLG